MKSLLSMVLIFGGGASLLGSLFFTAAMFPMSAFGGGQRELHAGGVGIAVGAVALLAGFVMRSSERAPESGETEWTEKMRDEEADLKRRANNGEL